jgi:hypothetical protein
MAGRICLATTKAKVEKIGKDLLIRKLLKPAAISITAYSTTPKKAGGKRQARFALNVVEAGGGAVNVLSISRDVAEFLAAHGIPYEG